MSLKKRRKFMTSESKDKIHKLLTIRDRLHDLAYSGKVDNVSYINSIDVIDNKIIELINI
ncbi:MAG: hypothetical protein ACRCX2_20225 [Paraclostridium sp.]